MRGERGGRGLRGSTIERIYALWAALLRVFLSRVFVVLAGSAHGQHFGKMLAPPIPHRTAARAPRCPLVLPGAPWCSPGDIGGKRRCRRRFRENRIRNGQSKAPRIAFKGPFGLFFDETDSSSERRSGRKRTRRPIASNGVRRRPTASIDVRWRPLKPIRLSTAHCD